MSDAWISELKERFDFNLGRVRGIVDAYERLGVGGPGRPSVQRTDLLRSAVVFLHAALEDLLRGVAEERLPVATPDVLERIPLPGPEKPLFAFTLRDLAAYRSETVDAVIRRAVEFHLQYSNYNNASEVANLLRQTGLRKEDVKAMLDS